MTCSKTYTAQFVRTKNSYTITWDVEGNKTTESYDFGETPSYKGETPTKASNAQYSYSFNGWSPSITEVTCNKTYTATFSESGVVYYILYNLDGGTTDNPTSYSIENGDFTLSYPIKNGYNFIGWTGSNGNTPQKDITILCDSTKNFEFTAHWELATYSINYHLFGGNNSPKNPSIYTTIDTIILANPSKLGYNFCGWFTDSAFSNPLTSLCGQYGNLDLFAKFTPNVYSSFFDSTDSFYTLTYSCGDATLDRIDRITKNDTVKIYDYIPKKSGCIFDGWFDEDGNIIKDSLLLVKDTIIYAKWYNDSLTNLSTGSSIDLKTTAYANTSRLNNAPSAEYYTKLFLPSYCDGNVTVKYSVLAKINDSNTVNRDAVATVKLDDITDNKSVFVMKAFKHAIANNFNGYGNSDSHAGSESIVLTPGHVYKISAYAFAYQTHVYKEKENKASAEISISQCSYNNFTASFSENVDLCYDSVIDMPSPHKDGYDFIGWFDENNEIITSNWKYLTDKSFHAKWELHNYNITFELFDGINNDENPQTFTMNDTIVLKDPTRKGYTFDGWYTDSQYQNKIEVIEGSSFRDYTLYAKWIANQYTALLDYNGGQNCPTINFYSQGNIIKTINLYKDSILKYFVPEAPSKNLKFGGWYYDAACTQLFSFDGIINNDTNIYAKWIEISNYEYSQLGNKVNVQINGANYGYIAISSPINQTITVTSSSGLDLYGEIYDSNWNLISTCDDISDENLDFSISILLEAGKIYYIGYKGNQVSTSGDCIINISGISCPATTITWDYSQIIESIHVTYGSSYILPIPKKEGYEFIGWFDENGNQIDSTSWIYSENITIFAHWKTI